MLFFLIEAIYYLCIALKWIKWTFSLTPEELKRCQHYCQYIKKIKIIRYRGDDEAALYLRALTELFLRIEGPGCLCPRLKEIEIPPEFTCLQGSYLLLDRLASPNTETVQLMFPNTPSSTLLSQYLGVIVRRSPDLYSLNIMIFDINRFGEPVPPGLFTHPPPMIILEPFGKMVASRTLHLDSRLISLDLLDVIGALPYLEILEVKGLLAGHADKADPNPREGLFQSLSCLKISGPETMLKCLFDAYFSNPPQCVTTTEICVHQRFNGSDAMSFLAKLPDSTNTLDLIITYGSPVHLRCLKKLAACDKLTTLKVAYASFFSLQTSDGMLFRCWRNLTILHLWKLESAEHNLPVETHDELFEYHPEADELDIYTIGLIAESLPNLIGLCICVLACTMRPTGNLGSIIPFPKLDILQFGPVSFINWKLDGFDRDEAARYLTHLLPSDAQVNFEFVTDFESPHSEDDDEEAALEALHGSAIEVYYDFISGFESEIESLMSERESFNPLSM